MTTIGRVVGMSAVAVAALAIAAPSIASADAPAMSVTMSGNTVTISGTCPKGGTDAEAWYGVSGGQSRAIASKKMTNKSGKLSATFSGVAPGTYDAVMGCQSATDTAVQRFTVSGKKKPKGAPKTGGGPAVVWVQR